jgi:hypothetical protein
MLCAECMDELLQSGASETAPQAVAVVQGYSYCLYHATFYLGHREAAGAIGPPPGVEEAFDSASFARA